MFNFFCIFKDTSTTYLPEPSGETFDSSETPKNILQDQTSFNLLLVGSSDGFVNFTIFGCLSCASLNLNAQIGSKCSIKNIHLSENLNYIFITVQDEQNKLKIVIFRADIFKTHINELFSLGLKQIKLMFLLNYLSSTITTITESWESILLELDNKLSKYASRVVPGGVTADFLELLVFGFCSEEMKEFLIHDLTKKGLEKFGQTIEMSYSNIQNLLLKYIMKYGQNLTYHLAEMRGMARMEHRFKVRRILFLHFLNFFLYFCVFFTHYRLVFVKILLSLNP